MIGKKKKLVCGILAMLVLILGTGILYAQAEETATKLFTLKIKEGSADIRIPVYEYRDGEQIRVDAEEDKKTVTLGYNAGTVKISVGKKTAYMKETYASVACKKTKKLSSAKNAKDLKVAVKDTAGKIYSFSVRLVRPRIPKITSAQVESTSVEIPTEVVKASLKAETDEALTFSVRIKDSDGKVVYKQTVGQSLTDTYQFFWDGKASAGNKAGYEADTYVRSGNYTFTGYLSYKIDGRKKTISASREFAIRNISSAVEEMKSVKGNPWPWVVILSGDKRVDYIAEVICKQILSPDMTEVQRARAIYDYLCTHYIRFSTYAQLNAEPIKIDYTSSAAKKAIKTYKKTTDAMLASGAAVVNKYDAATPDGYGSSRYSMALKMLAKQIGDCHYAATGFAIMLRHAGLEANVLHSNVALHYWSTVRVDGKWYQADVGMDGVRYYLGSPYSPAHFLRGKKNMTKVDDQVMHAVIDPAKGFPAAYALVENEDYPCKR